MPEEYPHPEGSSSVEAIEAVSAPRKKGGIEPAKAQSPLFSPRSGPGFPSYLDVIETNGVPAPIEAHKKAVLRYSDAKKRTLEYADFLKEVGEDALSAKISGCGTYLLFRNYYTAGQVRLIQANLCRKHLACVLCAIRRGAKHLRAYVERWEAIRAADPELKPQLVTFTVRNGPDLGERYAHLRRSLAVLRNRQKNFKKGKSSTEWGKVLGLVGAIEVTNKGKGWHPHCHMITLSHQKIEKEKLRDEWKEITKDSFEIDVRDLNYHNDPAKDFSEVFKYSIAFFELDNEQRLEAFYTFKGKRLIFSTGLFRGIPEPETLTDDPLRDLPYIDLLYRYYHQTGYKLRGGETPALPPSAVRAPRRKNDQDKM